MEDNNLKGVILWCAKQKKGIKIVEPNNNLCDAYLKKAGNSLKAMKLNMDAGLFDWAVDAAYYARYHAIYALLQKCGIDSEIHDCSIALIKFLFKGKLTEDLINELQNAKKDRVSLVYYTNQLIDEKEIRKNVALAPNFVLAIEKIISELNDVNQIREILREVVLGNDKEINPD